MTNADRPAFAELLAALAETFNEVVTEPRAEFYFDALADLDVSTVRAAVRHVIRSNRYFPKPAELRGVLPSAVPGIDALLRELNKALWAYRPMRPAPIVSPFVAKVIEALGGWRVATSLDEPSRWHRVRMLYEPMRAAVVTEEGDPRRALPPAPSRTCVPSNVARPSECRDVLGTD